MALAFTEAEELQLRRAFQVEEHEPVLKRAASVFADMVASATSSVESCARSNYPNDIDDAARENPVEPFPTAAPFWEDFQARGMPPPASLLDLNIPPNCSGGGGGGEEGLLIDFQEFHYRFHDVSKAPSSQYHYDDLIWDATAAAAAAATHGHDDPFHPYNVSSSHDPGYNGGVSQASAPPPPVSCSGGNVQARMPRNGNLLELLYGRRQEVSPQVEDVLPAAPTSDGTKVQDKAGDEDGGVVEPLYSRIRSQEEDEQDLEFGNFWDGEKTAHLSGSWMSDCQDLVSSISNLSKILLSQYRAKKGPNSPLQQAGINDLQSAILDLSKCLVHAYQQNTTVEDTNQVEESKNPSKEDPNFGLYSDTDEQHAEHDEDGNEQLVTRFKILLELAGKGPKDKSAEEEVLLETKDPEEKKPSSSYLDSHQVEQRLSLLRNRPKWTDDDDGAATLSDEEIQVGDGYVAKRTASLKELSDLLVKQEAIAAAENPGDVHKNADKGSDSSEESGWEHI